MITLNILDYINNNLCDSLDTWCYKFQVVDNVLFGCYLLFAFVLFLLVILFLMYKGWAKRVLDWISRHLLVSAVTVWLAGALTYLVGFYNDNLNALAIVPRVIISSFKMFVVSNDLARVAKILQDDAIYMTVFSIIHFAAALIAFLFVFNMIGYKIKSSLNIIIHRWFSSNDKVVHLFWGVNDASCALAEDIHKHCKSETIIFIDVDNKYDDDTQNKATLINITDTITLNNSEIARLEAIDALIDHCYNGPASVNADNITDVFGFLNLKNVGDIIKNSSKSHIYFLSDDEEQNISAALNMQYDKRLCSMCGGKPVIYIHARRDANNELFDHYSQYDSSSTRMEMKIIDSSYLSVATLKQDAKALPVNCVNIDKATGIVDAPFTALIVGFGSTGQEAFEFLYEYSAFIGPDLKRVPFRCYAVDEKMNRIEWNIKEKMPAINDEELVLMHTPVYSREFWSKINGIINELNYVVIALNNDIEGLTLAVNLFNCALMNRSKKLPKLKIMLRCYENNNEKRMVEVVSKLNESVVGHNIEIGLFGLESQLFRYNTILSDSILNNAKMFNLVYENSSYLPEEQWKINFGKERIDNIVAEKGISRYHAIYDINRRINQNIANVLHSRSKMILMGFDEQGVSDRLKLYYNYVNRHIINTTAYEDCPDADARLLLNLAIVEHERWIAAHKLMGFVWGEETNLVKKTHRNMCPWDKLDEVTKSYDCRVINTTIKLAYDRYVNEKR